MTDEQIREMLKRYTDAEMDLAEKSEPIDSVDPSPGFKRRMKRLFSAEKYFGQHIKAGYFVRYAAMFTGALLILAGIGEVSARVAGFNPWKTEESYIADAKLEQHTYQELKEKDSTGKEIGLREACRDVPSYVAGSLPLKDEDKTKDAIYMHWGEDEHHYIQYIRTKIRENQVFYSDSEYEQKEPGVVGGYEAFLHKKKDAYWISWNDEKYYYYINIEGCDDPENELMKMAESIYEQ